VSIAIFCERCHIELIEPGALLLSPPDDQWHVQKSHLCVTCWPTFVRQGLADAQSSELSRLREVEKAVLRFRRAAEQHPDNWSTYEWNDSMDELFAALDALHAKVQP
jgi:hypothetical protein